MKKILCYGDSATWGYNPVDGASHPFDRRWPGILQSELGKDYKIGTNNY